MNLPQNVSYVDPVKSFRVLGRRITQLNVADYVNEPLYELATHVYKNLWVNQLGSIAVFNLMFYFHDIETLAPTLQSGLQPNIKRYITGNTGLNDGVFIRVRLTRRPKSSAETEILYIANTVAEYSEAYFNVYDDEKDPIKYGVSRVDVVQTIFSLPGRFNPVIRRGPVASKLEEILRHSPDILLRNQLKAFKTWLDGRVLTSPKSIKNCFMSAIELSVTDTVYSSLSERGKSKLAHRNSRRYKSLNIARDAGMFDVIKAIQTRSRSYLRGVIIYVRTITGDVVETLSNFGVHNVRELHILVFAGHAYAVVTKPEDSLPESSVLVEVKRRPVPRGYPIYYWDMETTTAMVPYLIGLYTDEMHLFEGKRCVAEFMMFLAYGCEAPHVILYAHNSGKFDTPILMAHTTKGWTIKNILEFGGRILSVTYRHFSGRLVSFRDSFPIVKGSLDALSKIYQVEHPKLVGTVNHDLFTPEGWEGEMERQPVREYMRNDVLSLMEIVSKFRQSSWDMYGFDPIDCGILTGPSIVKNLFLSHYYKPKISPLFHLPAEIEEHIRLSYHGGACSVGRRVSYVAGVPLQYHDIRSMYPGIMVNHPLPYGNTEYEEFDVLLDGWMGFVDIEFSGGNGTLNYFRMTYKTTGLVAPDVEIPQRITVYSEEIRFVREHNDFFNVVIKVLGGYRFHHGFYLKGITEDLYAIKQASKGNPTKYKAAKENVNSIYGHFGTRPWASTLVKLTGREDLPTLIAAGHLVEKHGTLAVINHPVKADIRYCATASAITALAYMQLMSWLITEPDGLPPFYWDTDSIVTTRRLPLGPEIGEWELEMENITEGVFVARKIYALRNSSETIVKIKGVSRGPYRRRVDTQLGPIFYDKDPNGRYEIEYDDIAGLLDGKLIRVSSFRVYGGRSRAVKLASVEAAKPMITVTGNMCNGDVDGEGIVRPLRIAYLHFYGQSAIAIKSGSTASPR